MTPTRTPGLRCPTSPLPDCLRSDEVEASTLLTRVDPERPQSNKVRFRWKKGVTFAADQVGDPVAGTTAYAVCVYDELGQRLFTASINAGERWTLKNGRYAYSDPDAIEDGVRSLRMVPGEAGKARVSATASNSKGTLAPLVTPPYFDLPVTAQLLNSVGTCWEGRFASIRKNEPGDFRAKGD